MKIICFGHRKQTGKDTSCNFLITELRLRYKNLNIVKAGFADKVKDVAFQLFGWAGLKPGDYYERPENIHLREFILPMIGKTPRQLWIGVGNGIRQATGYDDTWGTYLFETLKNRNVTHLFIKDLRFPAEASLVKSYGGKIYRVDNPRIPKVIDGADDPLANYEDWDGIINNDSDLKTLHSRVCESILPIL